jgi:NADPH:quinone reductase-like Zn-dependent oxidoreductase
MLIAASPTVTDAAPSTSAQSMQAIVYRRYGSPDVLTFESIPKPIPTDDQILIKVRAASVNPADWHYMRGTPSIARIAFGLGKPKSIRLGIDAAGQVEAVGRNVTKFKLGDEVFGKARGAFAEYALAIENEIAPKPTNLNFAEAAAFPVAALTALQALRDKGRIQSGQRILINGASGGVGTFAVQIAKSFGADVTGVCSSKNVDMIRSLGADQVTDYTQEDFTRGAERYDLILDNVGNRSLSECRRVMNPKGMYLLNGGGEPDDGGLLGPVADTIKALLQAPFVSQSIASFVASINTRDLVILKELAEANKLKPIIDRQYTLSETADAIRYLEQGRARGKVIITVDSQAQKCRRSRDGVALECHHALGVGCVCG